MYPLLSIVQTTFPLPSTLKMLFFQYHYQKECPIKQQIRHHIQLYFRFQIQNIL